MSMSDTLGDMLTRIRNAQRAKKSEVVSPASRLRENVLEVLKKEGYELASAEIAMIPSTEVELTDATEIKKMLKMIDMFDDNEDVQAVWHNWTGEDDE